MTETNLNYFVRYSKKTLVHNRSLDWADSDTVYV